MATRTESLEGSATDHQLLEAYEQQLANLAHWEEKIRHVEMEIFRRIQERGGTAIPNADENGEQIWVCEQIDTYASPRYNVNDFTPFLELLNQTELREVYTPEHTEQVTVKATWNTQKLKALALKNGLKWPEAVPTGRRLKFERKGKPRTRQGDCTT